MQLNLLPAFCVYVIITENSTHITEPQNTNQHQLRTKPVSQAKLYTVIFKTVILYLLTC